MGAIPWGFSHATKEVHSHGLPQGRLLGTDMVHPPLHIPPPSEEGGKPCQVDQNDRVPIPAVPILQTDSIVANTLPLHENSTTSMNVHPTSTKSTVVRGNAFVTAMSRSIPSVNSVSRTADSFPRRKCITSCPSPRAEHTQERTLWLCAVPATRRFTTISVTVEVAPTFYAQPPTE